MKVVVFGSAAAAKGKKTRHSSGKTIFDIADIVVDTCAPLADASVNLRNHHDRIGPVSTMAFVTCVWMTITTVAEILVDRGVKLYIHPSHNVPGDNTARRGLMRPRRVQAQDCRGMTIKRHEADWQDYMKVISP